MYLRTFEGTFETLRRYLIYLLIQVLLLFVTNINITTQINESIYLPYLYLYIHTSFVLYVHIHHYTCMLLILRILFYLLRTFEGIYVHIKYTGMFDCKKCPVHLVSFIKHHGLFVPYIDINFILFYF